MASGPGIRVGRHRGDVARPRERGQEALKYFTPPAVRGVAHKLANKISQGSEHVFTGPRHGHRARYGYYSGLMPAEKIRGATSRDAYDEATQDYLNQALLTTGQALAAPLQPQILAHARNIWKYAPYGRISLNPPDAKPYIHQLYHGVRPESWIGPHHIYDHAFTPRDIRDMWRRTGRPPPPPRRLRALPAELAPHPAMATPAAAAAHKARVLRWLRHPRPPEGAWDFVRRPVLPGQSRTSRPAIQVGAGIPTGPQRGDVFGPPMGPTQLPGLLASTIDTLKGPDVPRHMRISPNEERRIWLDHIQRERRRRRDRPWSQQRGPHRTSGASQREPSGVRATGDPWTPYPWPRSLPSTRRRGPRSPEAIAHGPYAYDDMANMPIHRWEPSFDPPERLVPFVPKRP